MHGKAGSFLDDKGHTGGLAQLGEHLLCKQGVVGSIPSSSTKKLKRKPLRFRFGLLEITVFSFFNNLEEVKFF